VKRAIILPKNMGFLGHRPLKMILQQFKKHFMSKSAHSNAVSAANHFKDWDSSDNISKKEGNEPFRKP
jgi:hypothetical protein